MRVVVAAGVVAAEAVVDAVDVAEQVVPEALVSFWALDPHPMQPLLRRASRSISKTVLLAMARTHAALRPRILFAQ